MSEILFGEPAVFCERFQVITPTMDLRIKGGKLEQRCITQWHANGCLPQLEQSEWLPVKEVSEDVP